MAARFARVAAQAAAKPCSRSLLVDYIIEVSGIVGNWVGVPHVLQLSLKTRNGKFCTCGTDANASNKRPFSFTLNNNEAVVGFFGSVGDHTGSFHALSGIGVGIASHS
jgi:hypothetical protein